MTNDELQLMQDWIVDTLSADDNRADPDSLESLILPLLPAAERDAFEVWTRIKPGGSDVPVPFCLIEYLAPAGMPAMNGISGTYGGDLYANGANIVWTSQGWRVTWRIDRRRMKAIAPLVKRTNNLLNLSNSVSVTGGTINACVRETPYQRTILDSNGIWYSIRGGDYVIIAQAS